MHSTPATLTGDAQHTVPAPQSAPRVASQLTASVPASTRRLGSVEPPAPHTGAEPASLPAAPTIRVSIGRIEVRAVLPPMPPARRATSSRSGHKLSLEEYLKQRQGGGR